MPLKLTRAKLPETTAEKIGMLSTLILAASFLFADDPPRFDGLGSQCEPMNRPKEYLQLYLTVAEWHGRATKSRTAKYRNEGFHALLEIARKHGHEMPDIKLVHDLAASGIKGKDQQAKSYGVKLLRFIGDKDDLKQLLKLTNDPNLSQEAMDSAAAVGGAAAVPALVEIAKNRKRPETDWHAAMRSIVLADPENAVESLKKLRPSVHPRLQQAIDLEIDRLTVEGSRKTNGRN